MLTKLLVSPDCFQVNSEAEEDNYESFDFSILLISKGMIFLALFIFDFLIRYFIALVL